MNRTVVWFSFKNSFSHTNAYTVHTEQRERELSTNIHCHGSNSYNDREYLTHTLHTAFTSFIYIVYQK